MKRTSLLATADIDAIWRRAAERVGFTMSRTRDAYATSDGAGEIAIGVDDALDDDDAFAQLVFHELCHAITEGEGALRKPDWGLDNVPEHTVREHACLRVQAYLAGRFGLRALMAPTTPYRAYYATLPPDALSDVDSEAAGDDACARARAALQRFESSAWRAPLEAALSETAAAIAAAAASATAHPLGFSLGPAGESCGSCAWLYVGGRGPASRDAGRARPPTATACAPSAAPGVRALGGASRLPGVRRVLPRGVSLGDRVDARSGRLAGAAS